MSMAESKQPKQQSLLICDPDTWDYTFDGHAGAGPSSAERWLTCTASLAASREFLETLTPSQQREVASASIAARQGTTAHAVGETKARLLLGEIDQQEADTRLMELAIMPPDGEEFTDEMEEHVDEYVDLIRQFHSEGREVWIERRVAAVVETPDGAVREIAGTADCIVAPSEKERTLVVADLKYGNGVNVDPDANPQVRIYGLGALQELVDAEGNLPDIDRIDYYICQPRLGGIKHWTESVDDLLHWRDTVLAPQLMKALDGPGFGATYEPSDDACQWCPARGGCAALIESQYDKASDLFSEIVEHEFENGAGSLLTVETLDNARLGELLAQIDDLEKLGKSMREEVKRRMFRGEKVPGFVLVNYTPPRKWAEEAATELEDTDDLWVRKMVTPTQALKMAKADDSLPAEKIEALIESPAIRPVVAREGDRRKEWTGIPPEQMFADESGDGKNGENA